MGPVRRRWQTLCDLVRAIVRAPRTPLPPHDWERAGVTSF